MTNLSLVLQMNNHFGLSRQSPHKTTSIRGGILLGRADSNICLMNVRRRFVQDVHEHLDESIGHHFFVVVFRKFKSVVKKDVGLIFVVIGIDNLNTLEGQMLIEKSKEDKIESEWPFLKKKKRARP